MEKDNLLSTRNLKILGALLVAAFFQVSLTQFVNPGLRYIDWLLLVVVYVGLQQRDHTAALLTATVAGVVKDATSVSGLIGISGIAYLIAAYLAERISSVIVLDNLPIRIGTVAAASFLNTTLQLVGYQILRYPIAPLTGQDSVIATLILSLIGNLIAAVLAFQVLDRVFLATTGQGLRRTQAMRSFRRRKYKVKSV